MHFRERALLEEEEDDYDDDDDDDDDDEGDEGEEEKGTKETEEEEEEEEKKSNSRAPVVRGRNSSSSSSSSPKKKPKSRDMWFDFIADTGDGGNSTYAIARSLAQPTLGVQVVTRRQAEAGALPEPRAWWRGTEGLPDAMAREAVSL